ncbi:hypothetical protein G6M87_11110 [Rhizobium rhizogenes]|uniref:hypothetical protein n=1 Tax=Rhizobium rhizogenes TaxID=359 RepID=UPI00157178DB|nr:hypothetical protein [Rhizobium rhizogenes]NTI22408.1 hypothetical protein [Rhizobium rhizogenes]QTG05991.1 hypothetical protein G6M87_11110 [Rhizobium rhizogenes]
MTDEEKVNIVAKSIATLPLQIMRSSTQVPDDIERAAVAAWTSVPTADWEANAVDIIGRAILDERERCIAAVASAVKEGMATIADELQDPSDETVEMVARAICESNMQDPDAVNVSLLHTGKNLENWRSHVSQAVAAITAVRGAFFSSESPDQT